MARAPVNKGSSSTPAPAEGGDGFSLPTIPSLRPSALATLGPGAAFATGAWAVAQIANQTTDNVVLIGAIIAEVCLGILALICTAITARGGK